MTVADLIEILKEKPQQAEVLLLDADKGGPFVFAVAAFVMGSKVFVVGTNDKESDDGE